MADEGSLELAPLRAKVVLDLTQFDEGMEQIVDKTDTLKDVNVPVKVEINTNSDGIEETTEGIEEANQETEQLADNLEVVNENVEQVGESTKVVTENLNEAKQVEQEMGRHDFIINYNGERIHAMEQSVEELTNATNIYQDALTRLNSTEAEFDEVLSLDFSTIEEFNEGINASIESLKDMIDESKGLKVDLTEAQEALKDYIPLWEELTKEQQEEFKSVGEVEYNLQALQTRFSEVSNAIRNLGDAMEKATAKQQQFNNAVKQTQVDVSEYNQEAMEFITGAERQAEATQESTAQLHTNGTAVEENGTMVEKWGNDWWTTATMTMISIQMITSSMGELLNTGAEVELSGIGLTETFGKQGAEAIKNFTQNANDANLTLQEVLPTAETLGLALRQYGGTKTQITGVTTQIMNMANQLQLATGGAVSFSEGADAIKQELAGQSYALQSLGINLSNTLLNQTALNSQWHTSYDKLDSYQQAVIKVDALQGQLNKTFGTTSTYLKTQAGQYQKNIAEFKNNMAKLGEDLLPLANAILPSILKIVEKIVSIVDKIKSNKWLENKIEWWSKVALKIGEVVLTLGLLGKGVATAIIWFNKLKMIINICSLVITSLNPISLVILGIIGAVVLLYEAWKHNWLNIRGITKKAVDGIEYYWGRCKADTVMIWNGIMTGLRNTWRLLSSEAKQQFNEVINKIKYYWGRCKADTLMIWNGIKNGLVQTWRTLTSEASEQWNMVVNKIKYYCGRCKADTLMIWNGIVTGIIQTITILKDEAIQQWNSIYYGIKQLVEEIKANVINDWESLKYGVLEVIETLENIIESIWNNIYSFSVNTVQDTVSAVISQFEGLYDDVVNIFDDIWNTISGIWNDITSKLGSIGGMINNATGGLFMSMPTGFTSLPTVNNFSTTNITNTTSTNLSTIQTQTDSLPIQSIPTIGELHIHSPQSLDPLETYNQMQQWSINMANGLY